MKFVVMGKKRLNIAANNVRKTFQLFTLQINKSSTEKSIKLSLYEISELKSLISNVLLLNPHSTPYG